MYPALLSKSLNDVEETVLPLESMPMFAGHQLLGDSIFVRFSRTILNIPSKIVNGSASVGYCVSGQRIKQLTKRIKEFGFKLEKKVIILIGTNDILTGCSLESMKKHFDRLMMLLQLKQVTHFVILTLPPVPKLALMEQHWMCLHNFNEYLIKQHDPYQNIYVIDICEKFLKQESPYFKPELEDQLQYWELPAVSPKRKADIPLKSTPKKRKITDYLADDEALSPFSAYINKVNRREWEDAAVSSDDEGWLPNVHHYIDESFWLKLKETIIVESEDKLPPAAELQLSLPTTPIRPKISPKTNNNKQNLSPANRRLMALVKNFIRLDYYELFFYNQRVDMVHPNEAGLRAIETMLHVLLRVVCIRRPHSL